MPIRLHMQSSSSEGVESITLEDREAVQELRFGSATLDPNQTDPPFALLEALERLVPEFTRFGSPATDPKVLKRVVEAAFANGQRQQVIEGQPLVWFASGQPIMTECLNRLGFGTDKSVDLVKQMEGTYRRYLDARAPVFPMHRPVSKERIRKERLIHTGKSDFRQETADYYQISEDWYEFHNRMQDLRDQWNGFTRAGLQEGRILASEELSSSSRLIHPNLSDEIRYKSVKPPYVFCFTSDLPETWFAEVTELHKRRLEAGKWMERVWRKFEGEGRRPNVDDLVTVARKKYDISENAAKEAWKNVKKGLKTKVGSIPKDKRVLRHEIREID